MRHAVERTAPVLTIPHAAQNSRRSHFPRAKSSGRLIASWKASRMTRAVCKGTGLFVALRGEKSDGHQFIEQAIEKGASVIVTEHEVQHARATCVVVENTRHALADLGAAFYDRPALRLKMAGSHRDEWQDNHDLSAQTYLREGWTALRLDRDGALRNRGPRFAGGAHDAGSRWKCRSCSRKW